MSDEKLEDHWGDFRDLVTHMFLESRHSCPDSDVIWYPATDAYETGDLFVVRMDLSGVRREDVKLILRENLLEVRGVRRDPAPEGRRTFHKMEIARGPFIRRLQLPQAFIHGEATAAYRDGILEIRIRAREEGARDDVEIELS